jgi:hypothetical protein
MNFPLCPDPADIENYRTWFEGLQFVLPCKQCRWKFKNTLADPDIYNRDTDFNSREEVTLLMVKIHNRVNLHTEDIGTQMKEEDAIVFYNQFRATDFSRRTPMHCTLHIGSTRPASDQRFLVDPDVAQRCHWTYDAGPIKSSTSAELG